MKWLLIILLIGAGVWGYSNLNKGGMGENGLTESKVQINDTFLRVEIADTDVERAQGLSGRTKLDEGSGLLFVFQNEGKFGFWMKDMNFPIDIAWLDKNKKIIYIAKNVAPETYPNSFAPEAPALYVLETNAGFFESSQIKVGDTLQTKDY